LYEIKRQKNKTLERYEIKKKEEEIV
jgi:hypothetical protein